jgi:phosphosulfolactate synthase (CoM biosynthesis protein A)
LKTAIKEGLGFIRSNPCALKPRKLGLTEMRGPYYSAYGTQHLEDVPETVGGYIDGLKIAGDSFAVIQGRG